MTTESMNDATSVHYEIEIAEAAGVVRACLTDPRSLAGCLPGATLSETEGHAVRGRLKLKLSAVPEHYVVEARLTEPRGSAGPVRLAGRADDRRTGYGVEFTMEFAVVEIDAGQTRCVLSGEVQQVSGNLPTRDRLSAQRVVDRLAPQFRRRLEEVASTWMDSPSPSPAGSADEPRPAQQPPRSVQGTVRQMEPVIAAGLSAARSAWAQVRSGAAKLLQKYLAMTSPNKSRSGRRLDD